MTELADDFRAMRRERQLRRASNLDRAIDSLNALREKGLPPGVWIERLNNDQHWVFRGPGGRADFWPSSRRWKKDNGPLRYQGSPAEMVREVTG